MKNKILLLIAAVIMSTWVQGQALYISHIMYTPQQLVEDILVTGCLEAYNITYTGDVQSIGWFMQTATVPNFLFNSGVVLSSGYVMDAAGPNNSGSTSSNTTGGSDPDLATLIASTINDAAVLEFDFIPADNVLQFNYSFGSDEYLEWVGSSFNDVFGFFLTGPNPLGANYVSTNIATIPSTTIPVSINNVNNVANPTYYINNGTGATPNNEAIDYDGYTVAMTAVANVVACETYHIKLAVSDAGDSAYDSGVFLEAGSLTSGEVVEMVPYDQEGAISNTIIEGCTNYYVFMRTDTTDKSDTIQVQLNITGTASTSSDISGFPLTFTIDTGVIADTIWYSAIMDNLVEGTEYLIFELLNGCPCTATGTKDTIYVQENVTLEGGIHENDTLICSAPGTTPSVVLHADFNTHPSITSFEWSTGATSPSIQVFPTVGGTSTYGVTITDVCGQIVMEEVDITVSDMDQLDIDVVDLECNNVCTGNVTVVPLSGFAPYIYTWNPAGLGQTTVGIANLLCEGNYAVTVTDTYGCTASAPFTVNQPPAMYLNHTSTPATCPGASDGILEVEVVNGQWAYSPNIWTYTLSGFNPVDVTSSPFDEYTFQNLLAGNYTVNVIDGRGCVATEVFTVDELQITFTTNIVDVECWGDATGSASIQINGGTAPYNYEWSNGSLTPSISNVVAGNYSCTIIDHHDCVLLVPAAINQPDRLVLVNSLDTLMCQGEEANLLASAQGGVQPYSYNWYNETGGHLFTGDLFKFGPTQTQIIEVEVVDDNGCVSDRNEILVEIYPDIEVNLYANIETICKGESTYLYTNIIGGNGGPYTITNADGDVLEPPLLVNPNETTTYQVFADDDCGSPQGIDQITIQVMDPPPGDFYAEEVVGCAPFEVKFHEISPDNGQNYLWNFGEEDNTGYSLSKDPVHVYDKGGLYDISLTVTSPEGCATTVVKQQLIEVLPQPQADVIPDIPSASILHPVIHFQNLTDMALDSATIYFGDGNRKGLSKDIFDDIQYVYSDTGIFTVMLIVENYLGCIDTAYTSIEIYTEHDKLNAPNAINPFSTNPENKVFKPFGVGVDGTNYHLVIYDRWGEKVFETFHMDHGWDGSVKGGKVARPGTYPWVAISKDVDGKTRRASGIVTIVY